MPRNTGNSQLKRRRRACDPMRDYDDLPAELRQWLSEAVLPWGSHSVRRAYAKAYAKTGDTSRALQELDALQQRLVSKDAQKVWGRAHPAARSA